MTTNTQTNEPNSVGAFLDSLSEEDKSLMRLILAKMDKREDQKSKLDIPRPKPNRSIATA